MNKISRSHRFTGCNCGYINWCSWHVLLRINGTLLVEQIKRIYLGSDGANDCCLTGKVMFYLLLPTNVLMKQFYVVIWPLKYLLLLSSGKLCCLWCHVTSGNHVAKSTTRRHVRKSKGERSSIYNNHACTGIHMDVCYFGLLF